MEDKQIEDPNELIHNRVTMYLRRFAKNVLQFSRKEQGIFNKYLKKVPVRLWK
jgi:hypothetical protein